VDDGQKGRRVTLPMGAASARLRHLLAVSATISMGALAVFALCHVLHDISYRGLIDSLAAMSSWVIVAALAATAVDFVVLFANDFGALRYARAAPPVTSTLLASFCGYALGNFIGFGALSGGAVRYRIYRAVGVSPPKIARITIYIATAFGIGAAATIGLGLAFRAHEIAQLYAIPYESLRLIAVSILAATAAVLIGCAFGRQSFRLGPVTIELPSSGLVLVQIAVTMVDIIVAAGTLWVLLPASGVDFLAFVVIFTAALSLGVLSHAPGGIGVFDAAVLYAVGTAGRRAGVWPSGAGLFPRGRRGWADRPRPPAVALRPAPLVGPRRDCEHRDPRTVCPVAGDCARDPGPAERAGHPGQQHDVLPGQSEQAHFDPGGDLRGPAPCLFQGEVRSHQNERQRWAQWQRRCPRQFRSRAQTAQRSLVVAELRRVQHLNAGIVLAIERRHCVWATSGSCVVGRVEPKTQMVCLYRTRGLAIRAKGRRVL